jgi:hypothetical protein
MFVRPEVQEKGMMRKARVGDGFMAAPLINTVATAGNLTLTVAAVLAGVAQFTGAAGAVAYTLPLATDLIAAMPDMDIGDSYVFVIQNTAAQAATVTTNTGITLTGNVVINAASKFVVLTKTAATTMNACVL